MQDDAVDGLIADMSEEQDSSADVLNPTDTSDGLDADSGGGDVFDPCLDQPPSCEVGDSFIREVPAYSAYHPGGSIALRLQGGVDGDEVTAYLDGEEVDTVPVGDRRFVSIPGNKSGDVELKFVDGDGQETTFSRRVRPALLDSAEVVIAEQRDTAKLLLEGAETKFTNIQRDRPEGLLDATETVSTSLDEKVNLLAASEQQLAAGGLQVVVPVMLRSQETAVPAPEEQTVPAVRKQEQTCEDVTSDLVRITDALSFEAGTVLAVATPLLQAETPQEDVAAIVAGIGWSYWIDDMLEFLRLVDSFGDSCAPIDYAVSVDEEAYTSGESLVVNDSQVVEVAVDVTRQFDDASFSEASAQIRPLIDAVMGVVGSLYGGFDVDVSYLESLPEDGILGFDDAIVAVDAPDGVTAEAAAVTNGFSLTFSNETGETQTVTVTVGPTASNQPVELSFSVEPLIFD